MQLSATYPLQWVRFGAMGDVAPFQPVDGVCYERGRRVVVRTPRGLELGEVLSSSLATQVPAEPAGPLLRSMTVEDELLEARLLQKRQDAFEACSRRLAEFDHPCVLMEVEHLFDGQTLVFHFLGDPPSDADGLLADLAEQYEAQAQFRRFTETLSQGCGPSCGESSSGCGDSCSTGCALAAMCSTKSHS